MVNGCIMIDCQNQGEKCETCNTGLNNYKPFGKDLTNKEIENYNNVLLTNVFKKTGKTFFD
jgi:hypothetical protein